MVKGREGPHSLDGGQPVLMLMSLRAGGAASTQQWGNAFVRPQMQARPQCSKFEASRCFNLSALRFGAACAFHTAWLMVTSLSENISDVVTMQTFSRQIQPLLCA